MTTLGHSVSAPGTIASGQGKKCDWSNCKSDHADDLKYPPEGSKKGKVTKGDYRDKWIKAGMEPFVITGGLPRVKYHVKDASKPWIVEKHHDQEKYRHEAHHLIAVECFDGKGTLIHNIELIGYDVDRENNGYILPEFEIDQPLHRLPKHSGGHCARYTDPISQQLSDIQKDFDGICTADVTGDLGPQKHLIIYLDQLSNLACQKMLAIRNPGATCWPLYNDSVAIFAAAEAEYQRRERFYKEKYPTANLPGS